MTRLLESLESRRLLSGASVHNHVLRVSGDPTGNNTINVNNTADGLSIDVDITWITANHVTKNFHASFLKSLGINKITIMAGKRADTINVAQTNGSIGIKTRIDSKQGADTINTGDEADVIYAGLGNDTVHCGSGNDLAYGGNGDDKLFGEDGNDTMWGGNGKDDVEGGNGDDKLGGVLGQNTLMGGAGRDTFVVKNLTSNPTNDYNPDEDVLVTKGGANGTGGDVDAPPGAE
jgi:Ca2+-binding RTX toxin-like protein